MRPVKKAQKLLFLCFSATISIWYIVGIQNLPREENLTTVELSYSYNINNTYDIRKPCMKYILQWTRPEKEPYTFMKVGHDLFLERHCPVNNCYVTWNKTYLSDITHYDAILIYSHDVNRGYRRLPKKRSLRQKFVFVSSESAAYYPVYDEKFDGFFNWTWTYKLNSDIFYGYILVRNKTGDIVGPNEVMYWPKIEEMKPIEEELKQKLINKKHAVAWFVSNCHSRSGRERVAKQIQQELAKYNMTLDIYGSCGTKRCQSIGSCWQMLENDYYFYLSFENSISEDYVTEKLLNALQHYTVPIVYGGANYTRFMPDGIYLNARTLSTEELVKQIIELINNKEKYYDLFRWHNHYTYYYAGDTPETDYFCNFCKKINDINSTSQVSIYQDLDKWWNGWKIGTTATHRIVVVLRSTVQ